MPFTFLEAELDDLDRAGLLRRRRIIDGPQGVFVHIDGTKYISFCSNDYLGLANHPRLIDAACEAAKQYGIGAGASHLVSGHSQAHHKLEKELALFVEKPSALLFSSGFMANMGVVSALVGRNDAIFCDKLNHASLNEAALLSGAKFFRYPHLDMDRLEKQLRSSSAKNKLVASDTVFSMDGDIAPIPKLLELCEKYGAWLLLDDAHGFGVLGNGKGSLFHYGIDSKRIIYMGTLGKAAGTSGAFVAGEKVLSDILIQRAKSYIYTTAQPSLISETTLAALDLIINESWRRNRLFELINHLKNNLKDRLSPSETPIQPLIVGENRAALTLSKKLEEQNTLVPCIRPPTVPKNTARLRISLSAAHSFEDIDRLIRLLR